MPNSNTTSLHHTDNGSSFFNVSTYSFPVFITTSTYIGFAIVVLAVLFNVEILITFLRRPSLITPFTIHVVNLTIINLITALAADPILLIHNIQREFFRGNRDLCSAYKYTQWSTGSLCALQHVIICFDRWLAVICPIWYRTKTVQFGVMLTVTALVYQQLWYLPLFIRDWSFPVAAGQFCEFTLAYPDYQQVARVAVLLLPQFVLFISYPVLLIKICLLTDKPRGSLVAPFSSDHDVTTRYSISDGYRQRLTSRVSAGQVRAAFLPALKRSRSELKLALCLVVLQVIFWTPMTVMTIMNNLRLTLRYQNDIATFAYMLPVVLVMVDPVMNLVYLRKLRMELFVHLKVMRKSFQSGSSA